MQVAILRYFCTLFSKDKGLLTNEVQILDLDHENELGDCFTIQKAKEVNVGIKNNKETGRDVLSAVAWKVLVIKVEGTEIFVKMFNVMKIKRQFSKE
jgi:hypothetical protein